MAGYGAPKPSDPKYAPGLQLHLQTSALVTARAAATKALR